MTHVRRWAPAVIFALGSILTASVHSQKYMELRTPLGTAIPSSLFGLVSEDLEISPTEARVAKLDAYLLRLYTHPDADADSLAPDSMHEFSLYVGYYGSQAQGRTIHSPKNCLPGNGWEALESRVATVAAPGGDVAVNRYLLRRDDQLALVLYWYQGRGRIEANEFRVKFDLLRDSALWGRSDEALVRIVVPFRSSEADAFQAAKRIAKEVIPAVRTALTPL